MKLDLLYLAGRLSGMAAMIEVGAADNAEVAKTLREIANQLAQGEKD